MQLDDVLGGFDLDIVLRDVSCDAGVPPVRRAIAALCIGVGIDDAWLSVRELREAVSLVHEGADGGRARLATILSTACDDFQRAIYYCMAGRGVGEMAEAMDWLLAILKARGRTAAWLSRSRVRRRDLMSPYVCEAPDGPLVSPDADFELGRSWFVDRGPGPY
ncbi:hypothetical protein FHS51_003769 [Sphingobium wenxiniae]|uniref:Uncharacterized protein n=1 Tax=Sphingobium wenxiniae (strain DSM 21828 / CGMCC 1.7748 / JZ-1) TaxID=595605 RepID=A0A562K4E8_SPHWJ|nr:hypothetical protein [Sphingobium wenxiniae]MBB6193512.1 hypothetical protein [Sphingobium wenxiniae]MBU3993421.1 hypothetical protein [Alphaproteobacteria bacterium]TWH90216.1 hypothetical protein IQ35_03610 [Sphingobium wenxiniae]